MPISSTTAGDGEEEENVRARGAGVSEDSRAAAEGKAVAARKMGGEVGLERASLTLRERRCRRDTVNTSQGPHQPSLGDSLDYSGNFHQANLKTLETLVTLVPNICGAPKCGPEFIHGV